MKRALFLTLLLVLGALTLIGCSPPQDKAKPSLDFDIIVESIFSVSEYNGLTFFHDTERGVGIWFFQGHQEAGLAVLPDNEYTNNY